MSCPYLPRCATCEKKNPNIPYAFCNVYREIKREERQQAESQLDINVEELFIGGSEMIR